MHVHTIKISFSRQIQPKDYENAIPAAELTATLEEGEDAAAKAMELMATACETVYAAIGFKLPSKAAALLVPGAGERAQVTTSSEVVPAADPTEAIDPAVAAKAEKAAKAKATREANKAKKVEEAAKNAAESDIPDDSGSAKESAKAAPSDDIPDAAPAPDVPKESAGGMDSNEFSEFVAQSVANNQVSVPRVKELLATYGAARLGEVSPGDRLLMKSDIENPED